MPAPSSKRPAERDFVVNSGASMHMMSKIDLSSWVGCFAKIQEPHNGGDGQWRSANKWGSTSVCLRSWALRDGADPRRHVCSSITWKTLRRTRLYQRVGQWTKATSDQERDNNRVQYGKFCSCCCPRIVFKLERMFVFHIFTAESNKTTRWRYPRASIRKPWRSTQKSKKNKIERRATIKWREFDCEISQNGWRSSQKFWKMKECQHQGTHP